MTTVEALKALYLNLGGSEADFEGVNLNPEAVEKIAELVEGGVGGEDFVFVTTDLGDASKYEMVKGSYEALVEKIKAGKPLSGRIADLYNYNEANYPNTDNCINIPLNQAAFDGNYASAYLYFGYVRPMSASTGTIQSIGGTGVTMNLNASGVLTVAVFKGNKTFA